jgi:hypothetical protein
LASYIYFHNSQSTLFEAFVGNQSQIDRFELDDDGRDMVGWMKLHGERENLEREGNGTGRGRQDGMGC